MLRSPERSTTRELRLTSRSIVAVKAIIATWLLAVSAYPVAADMLDAASCKVLLAQKEALDAAGVTEQIALGPKWAADNLDAASIQRIKTYITLEEQILFRCPSGFQNAVVLAIKGQQGDRSAPPLPFRVAGTSLRPVRTPPVGVGGRPQGGPARAETVGRVVPIPEKNLRKTAPAAPAQVRPPIPKRKSASAPEAAVPIRAQWRREAFKAN